MNDTTAYERALREQIAYLEAEIARLHSEREAPAELPTKDDPPIAWALTDPNFRQWLLRRQLGVRP